MDKANRQVGRDSWDTYWEGTSSIGAYTGGGVSHPAVTRFWNDFFAASAASDCTPMLDIATGNGSVIEVAVSRYDFPATEISCVDVSPAAVAVVRSRFPGVTALVADAAHLPFEHEQFGLVASQFGVEYAGRDAILSACEQVAAGGTLALMLHCRDSSIYHESAVNLAAVSRLRESGFIPLAADFFEKGFAAVKGADRAPYDEAGAELAGAVHAVENILSDYGQRVAGDVIARLYNDVAKIHGALPRYDSDETLQWLDAMDREIHAYALRMQTMLDAAVDETTFRELITHLENREFMIREADLLMPDAGDKPVAWVVVAVREQSSD